jgi:hypothetical protein
MAKDITHEIKAAKKRFRKGRRREGEGAAEFYESEEARDRVWEAGKDPAFNHLPENTLPETRKRRAEERAKLSAASRVRDRSEVDLCKGTGKYLGVACPGCRACRKGGE